jgi:RNA polymerase sigma-70 factor, ECF subfamily
VSDKVDTDRPNFDRVTEGFLSQVFRFLRASTRDVDVAEWLTQECFLKAHRNWGSFRGESSPMTWLMTKRWNG